MQFASNEQQISAAVELYQPTDTQQQFYDPFDPIYSDTPIDETLYVRELAKAIDQLPSYRTIDQRILLAGATPLELFEAGIWARNAVSEEWESESQKMAGMNRWLDSQVERLIEEVVAEVEEYVNDVLMVDVDDAVNVDVARERDWRSLSTVSSNENNDDDVGQERDWRSLSSVSP